MIDEAPGVGELDGIPQKIRDDLLKASRVAKHVQLFTRYIEPERDVFFLRCWLERLDAACNDGRQLHPSLLQLKLSRQDARHVEEVVDRLRLNPDVSLTRRAVLVKSGRPRQSRRDGVLRG